MKRINNLYDKFCTIENINLADTKARKAKRACKKYIYKHDENQEKENNLLLETLRNFTYKTSAYTKETIYEPKERILFKLPYYPDRIVHHSIMNVTKEIWTKLFIQNTYSCIEGRGILKCAKAVKKALKKFPNETQYCLKFDIKKYYPSINHQILKQIVRRKIKDNKFLQILDEIIDSVNEFVPNPGKGIPIGNYTSQYFANLYLSYFDHWCKEKLRCKFYFRYADDIVILSNSKSQLWEWFCSIKDYLKNNLDLDIKSNYQVFPVENRGIDFVGYKFYHNKILLRKSIKQRMFRLIKAYQTNKISKPVLEQKMCAYYGWLKFANSKNLLRRVETLTGLHYSNFSGNLYSVSNIINKMIRIVSIKQYNTYYVLDVLYKNTPMRIKSKNTRLYNYIKDLQLPCYLKIQK